jgi:tight adherence protein C
MYLYLVLGVVLIGVAVASLLNAAGLRRMRTAERLSTIHGYGFTAEPDPGSYRLSQQPTGSFISTAATWLGDLLSKRMGSVGEDDARDELMAAGMYTISPRTLLGYRVVAVILTPILVFFALGVSKPLNVLMIFVGAFGGWTMPLTIVRRRARKRLDVIDRKLPDLIDLLCVMIEAGLSFGSAMRLASTQIDGPLGDELRLTLQEQTMGLAIDEALGNFGERADTPAVRAFVRAMGQGERMGISTGQIMRNLAGDMRARRRSQAEEKAQKAPVVMLFPLVFLIFPAMFIILMTPAMINLINSFKGV